MVKIEIEVSNKLATKFQEAVDIYNAEHEITVTLKQALIKLLRNFTIDTIRSARVKTAQSLADEEVQDL